MSVNGRQWLIRVLAGGVLGAVLAPAAVCLMGFFFLPIGETAAAHAMGALPRLVTPAMAEAFDSVWLAAAVQSLLGSIFGAVVAMATLPFADGGKDLVLRSLAHFGATALSFSALLWVCRWVEQAWFVLVWVILLAILYALIWLGRWIGWYVEVMQLRMLLGLNPGPSPLKWRETAPYLPFVILVCDLLPMLLWWGDRALGNDVPALSGLILPLVLLPAAGFFSGFSLGKRQGICPLYPVACFVCYLPMVYGLFNGSALFHCFLAAIPALAGNVLGGMYRRAVPKHHA